jgi:high-affinity nickel-transport protein
MDTQIGTDGLGIGLFAAAAILGLRHGIDWDHIAALTDISASQDEPRSGFKLGTLYIAGHAAVVVALGVVAISLGATIPDSVDDFMSRIVGVTLIAMGVYIAFSLIRHGAQFRMRSRWMVALGGIRWIVAATRRLNPVATYHDHEHAAAADLHHAGGRSAETCDDARDVHAHPHTHVGGGDYGAGTATGVGVLHGVGAETPTQVVIFLAAANAGGVGEGLAVLLAFVLGLVAANTALNLASAFGFLAAGRNPAVKITIGATTAMVSVALGVTLLIGADMLPAIFTV